MAANVTSGNTYIITNVKAGTAVDLSVGDNRTVTGWAPHGQPNQRWQLNWTDGAWTFKNNFTGTYLGIEGPAADGTRLVASPAPFSWHIWHDQSGPNTFRIFVPNTSENLDLYGYGNATSGNPITLWATWNGTHQTWNFNQGSSSICCWFTGAYRIVSRAA